MQRSEMGTMLRELQRRSKASSGDDRDHTWITRRDPFQFSKGCSLCCWTVSILHHLFFIFPILCFSFITQLVRQKVVACAKHYVGDGGTTRGRNENNTLASRHDLLGIHMAPYYNAVIKGVASVMVSYSSWNGIKMHANRDLITGFLKNTLHFRVRNQLPFPCTLHT